MRAFQIILGAVVLILVAAGLYVYFVVLGNTQKKPVAEDLYTQTLVSNQAYSDGVALFKSKSYEEAGQKFEEALAQLNTGQQEGLILYRLGASKEEAGDYAGAIAIFKSILKNPDRYTRTTRAYAAQEMGLMLYKTSEPSVVQSIFMDEPFKSMYVEGDRAKSLRNVFEYSAKILPLANAELRIADWYANELFWGRVPATEVSSYKEIIRSKISSAEEDINRIRILPNEMSFVSQALLRKAVVIAKMTASGDDSFGDYNTAFQTAINVFALGSTPSHDGITRFYYAYFLAHIGGASRNADIHTIISPVYESDIYRESSVERFFASEKDNILDSKFAIKLIAAHDEGLKVYLKSLGWDDTDFESASQ